MLPSGRGSTFKRKGLMFATLADMSEGTGKPVIEVAFFFAPIPAKPSLPELPERPPEDPPLLPLLLPPGVGSGRLDLVGEVGALLLDDGTAILLGEVGCEIVCVDARPLRVGDALEIEDDVGVPTVVLIEVLTDETEVLMEGNERCAPGEGRGRR